MKVLAVAAALVLVAQSVPPQTGTEPRGIYDAVLREVFARHLNQVVPASYVLKAEYRAMGRASDRVWTAFAGAPAALRTMVEQAIAAPPGPDDVHDPSHFAAAAHIVPTAEVTALTRSAPIEPTGYPAVAQKYQARALVSLSKIVLTADRLDAMVYFSIGCGLRCGADGYVWLHRKTIADSWTAKLQYTGMA